MQFIQFFLPRNNADFDVFINAIPILRRAETIVRNLSLICINFLRASKREVVNENTGVGIYAIIYLLRLLRFREEYCTCSFFFSYFWLFFLYYFPKRYFFKKGEG